MNTTVNVTILKTASAEIIADGLLGNSMILLTAVVGLLMSTTQIVIIHLWQPLRSMQQTLVLNAALADALKSVSYIVPCIKRLYLASNEKDEVISQFDCMYWILAPIFTTLYGLSSLFTLSLERLIVIGTPVWYWKNKRTFSLALAASSCTISLAAASTLFFGVSRDLLLLSCNIMSSTTPTYYVFMVYFQDLTTGSIILVNFCTGVMLIRRWRAALTAQADMKQFKKEIQLNAVKAVFSVVALCLLSFFSGMVFMTVIQNFDMTRRAYYGPFWGCLQLSRGVFDFGLWMCFCKKYQEGFRAIFGPRCFSANQIAPQTEEARKDGDDKLFRKSIIPK